MINKVRLKNSSDAPIYGVLIAFLICSYFMFATIGGLTGEAVKLFAMYAILAFILAIILHVILFIAAILADISYYGSIVFLIISSLTIIYLMLSGHQGAAFGWPIVASIIFPILLFIVLVVFMIFGPFFIPALVISTVLFPIDELLALSALIFVSFLTIIGISLYLSKISEGYELKTLEHETYKAFLPYLAYAGGFYSSCIAANFVFTTAVVKDVLMNIFSLNLLEHFFEYLSSFIVNSSTGGTPLSMVSSISRLIIPASVEISAINATLSVISSILFGLLFSSVYCRIAYRKYLKN